MVKSLEKVTEKSARARKDFFEKALPKVARIRGYKDLQEVAEELGEMYLKAFGRVGIQPMLALKSGKKRPRYIVNRDEVWVLYKPPLWQMGANLAIWGENVQRIAGMSSSLEEAQQTMMADSRPGTLQEWHGLCQGRRWLDDPAPSEWGFVQRLDLETDGPVLIAKSWRTQRFLQVQMKDHVFSKAYICLVHGRVPNRVQHVKCSFVALGGERGGEAGTQVMLKRDALNDPFFNLSMGGQFADQFRARNADTFFKPLAYYQHLTDGSEYTLVYVNILSGITHQIRITMQSVGHPLVSDDRYLPKEQAMKDITWCPRNFLCEVRQDWFDMSGPHSDPERKGYTRISIENPLPKLFQNLLENKLKLVEQLDPTADLYLGCTYWAIGDEQLMMDFKKDEAYRKKVYRWGARREIHPEALDRLLLLKREEIDEILNQYKPHDDPAEDSWVCPVCMQMNMPGWATKREWDPALAVEHEPFNSYCAGYQGKTCPGKRYTKEEEVQLAKGYKDYLQEPTLHLLLLVNARWLEARRNAFKAPRASWEKVPEEDEGDLATEEQCESLHERLVDMARAGAYGLQEEDLRTVPGFKDVKLPVRLPKECQTVRRTRLPGSGTCSSWTYTLSGKVRLEVAEEYSCRAHMLPGPVPVKTGKLHKKMVMTDDQILEVESAKLVEATKADEENRQKQEEEAWKKEKWRREEAKMKEEAKQRRLEEQKAAALRRPKKRKWQRLESNNGGVYYLDPDTGETSNAKPPDYEEAAPVWQKCESSSNPGHYYYNNTETGESRTERPKGVPKILNDDIDKKQEPADWQRIESRNKPGRFFYFNSKTGASEEKPPHVKPPWELLPSRSHQGQFYYFHQETGETTEHPPNSAVPASEARAQARQATPVKTPSVQTPSVASTPAETATQATGKEIVPAGWVKKASSKYPGKFYYQNVDKPQVSRWTAPQWERVASSTVAGKFYFRNVVTGATTWDSKEADEEVKL